MADHVHSKSSKGYITYQNNTKHNRKIIKLKDRYRKIWYGENPQQKLGTKNLVEHVRLLDKFNPGYILDYNLSDEEMNGFLCDKCIKTFKVLWNKLEISALYSWIEFEDLRERFLKSI